MTSPHKWAEQIKAWADGKKIECRFKANHLHEETRWSKWQDTLHPSWYSDGWEYRVKPEMKSIGQLMWEAWYPTQPWKNAYSMDQWEKAANRLLETFKENGYV